MFDLSRPFTSVPRSWAVTLIPMSNENLEYHREVTVPIWHDQSDNWKPSMRL